MDSIVQGLADVYDVITLIVARGAYWLSVVLLVVAALGALAMVVDLLFLTSSGRFRSADRAAQPRDGIILIGQIMAGVSIAGGVVLLFRDTASPWQPAVALVGGAALLALLVMYRRADEERQAGMARLVWLALAVISVIAVVLAYMQRNDSAIPYMGLADGGVRDGSGMVHAGPPGGALRRVQGRGEQGVAGLRARSLWTVSAWSMSCPTGAAWRLSRT